MSTFHEIEATNNIRIYSDEIRLIPLVDYTDFQMSQLRGHVRTEMNTLYDHLTETDEHSATSIHEMWDILTDEMLDDPTSYPKLLVDYLGHIRQYQLGLALDFLVVNSYMRLGRRFAPPAIIT